MNPNVPETTAVKTEEEVKNFATGPDHCSTTATAGTDRPSGDEFDIGREIDAAITKFFEDVKTHQNSRDAQLTAEPPRKRPRDDDVSVDAVNGIFLRSVYPLDRCLVKNVTVGVFSALDFSPGVMLNQYGKVILFTKPQWDSFAGRFEFMSRNLLQNTSGKKTKVLISGSDIEVDNMKIYGKHYIRLKDGPKQDGKVLITKEDFSVLQEIANPVTRYLEQLVYCESVIKDYLIAAVHKKPDAVLPSRDVDASIMNRLPHEVMAYMNLARVVDESSTDPHFLPAELCEAVLGSRE